MEKIMSTQEKVNLFLSKPTKESFEKIKYDELVLNLIYVKINKNIDLNTGFKDTSLFFNFVSEFLKEESLHDILYRSSILVNAFTPVIIDSMIAIFNKSFSRSQLRDEYNNRDLTEIQRDLLFEMVKGAKGEFEDWEWVFQTLGQREIFRELAVQKMSELM